MTNWEDRRQDIRERIDELGVETFLDWPVIGATMYVGEGRCVRKERPLVGELVASYQLGDLEPNQIHQLHHLKVLLDYFPDALGASSVVEIGAGYGDLALLFRRMGYDGRYAIYDFPEMREIQDYYLSTKGVDGVSTAEPPFHCDLLIACFSLSEMSIEDREAVLAGSEFDRYLIAYASSWDGVDNDDYFAYWPGRVIAHPCFSDNISYLVGGR